MSHTKIKMLVMDVDGTMTDGKIYMGNTGELMKAFDVRDGYAIRHLLRENGVVPVIITGRASSIVQNRARELNITELYQGIGDKLYRLKTIAAGYGLTAGEIAYLGDDLNDLECIRYCGISGCPRNAVKEIRETVDYVCEHSGGDGAVREFIEKLVAGELEQ